MFADIIIHEYIERIGDPFASHMNKVHFWQNYSRFHGSMFARKSGMLKSVHTCVCTRAFVPNSIIVSTTNFVYVAKSPTTPEPLRCCCSALPQIENVIKFSYLGTSLRLMLILSAYIPIAVCVWMGKMDLLWRTISEWHFKYFFGFQFLWSGLRFDGTRNRSIIECCLRLFRLHSDYGVQWKYMYETLLVQVHNWPKCCRHRSSSSRV